MSQAVESKKNEGVFTDVFGSFSVDDISAAKTFYADTLGVDISEEDEGFALKFPGGGSTFVYPKDDHVAASFTILNFQVDDIDAAVEALKAKGVEFESYDGEIETDGKGIHRGADAGDGPNIAWFKDPAGNILSVMEGK
jgi:predicted enzyme related to lactoylglutathione lyase